MLKIPRLLPFCNSCLRRPIIYNVFPRHFSSPKEDPEFDNTPIKYSSSRASQYKAKYTRTGYEGERLWYEPYVVLGSITVFLVYFCILREENDIDKELGVSLYSRIEGLEEYQLRMSLRYNLDNGLDTTAIRERLAEIDKEKRRVE